MTDEKPSTWVPLVDTAKTTPPVRYHAVPPSECEWQLLKEGPDLLLTIRTHVVCNAPSSAYSLSLTRPHQASSTASKAHATLCVIGVNVLNSPLNPS